MSVTVGGTLPPAMQARRVQHDARVAHYTDRVCQISPVQPNVNFLKVRRAEFVACVVCPFVNTISVSPQTKRRRLLPKMYRTKGYVSSFGAPVSAGMSAGVFHARVAVKCDELELRVASS